VRGLAEGPVGWVRHRDAARPAAPKRELLESAIIADLPPDTDELEARSRRGERLVVVRDAAYLEWRWRRVPFGGVTTIRASAGGVTRGLAFVQDDARSGYSHVADLLHVPDDEAAQRSLLRRAIAVADRLGRSDLWYLTRDLRSEALLREEGFVVFEAALPRFIVKVNRAHGRDAAGAVLPQEWSPSLGDTDMLFNCSEPRPAARNDAGPAARDPSDRASGDGRAMPEPSDGR
jgi:hypothetical protein